MTRKKGKDVERNKVIIVDYSIFMFRAIFAGRKNKQMTPTYNCVNMIVSCLRKIGVEPTDKIILACDYGRSWRKELSKEYKADREKKRKQYKDIDWDKRFKEFNQLIEDLDKSTSWLVVKEWSFEFDDFASVAPRYFKNNEIIIISYDKDMEQLCSYPNVKLFSPLIKYKGKKGAYKLVEDPYKVLADKIEKEASDNLKSKIVTTKDYELRETLVSLLKLPRHIEEKIVEIYSNLKEKQYIDKDRIPFKKDLKKRIINLYNDKKNIVDYEECIEYIAKKRKGKKKCKK